MAKNSEDFADCQRTTLLRQGIVVLDVDRDGKRSSAVVCAPPHVDAAAGVRAELGRDLEVEVVGDMPRRHWPVRCVGHMEREPGRLQVRFVLSPGEHVDDIVVAEDNESVVVLATVCAPIAVLDGEVCEVPCHVYLDRPLGDRGVIDGHSNTVVPYFNVHEHLRREFPETASAG